MRYRSWLVIGSAALALVTAALLEGCREPRAEAQQPAGPAPATAAASSPSAGASTRPVVEVRRATLRRYAPAVGSFRAARTTKLAPQVSGRVQDVLVDVGDHVEQGQLLVRLDPVLFDLEVQQSAAALEAARSAMDSAAIMRAFAEREMKRQLDVFANGAGSTKDRDDAIGAYEKAAADHAERVARLTEAQKRLEYAQQRLRETEIRAPYDGAITARLVDPGEAAMTMPPTTVLEIREVGRLYLEFSLPQDLLDRVDVGTPIEFDVEGVKTGDGTGTIAVIFPAVDEATRSFRCRAVIPNGAHKYQPGLLARVRVVAQEVQDALVVPRTALAQTTNGWQVMIPGQTGPAPRAVEVGLITDDLAQVTAGLKEGDQVVSAAGARM